MICMVIDFRPAASKLPGNGYEICKRKPDGVLLKIKRRGNAYCKTHIYPDVKTEKSERQNQLYIQL